MKKTVPGLDSKFTTPFYDEYGKILIDLIQLNTRIENKELYGKNVTVSGWGVTGKENQDADRLKYTTTKSVNLKSVLSPGSLRLFGFPPGRGACQGDSGGKMSSLMSLFHLKLLLKPKPHSSYTTKCISISLYDFRPGFQTGHAYRIPIRF